MTIAHQLRRAAESEITKATATNTIVEHDITHEAVKAFDALSTLLGQDDWFFGQERPSLFDASVFAYTHLILSPSMKWRENKLAQHLKEYGRSCKTPRTDHGNILLGSKA